MNKPKYTSKGYRKFSHDGSICPMCGENSWKLGYGDVTIEGNLCFENVYCYSCESEWCNVYIFDGYNVITDKNGNEFDMEGDLIEHENSVKREIV